MDSTHYEVRSAGKTIRLYTNGVFHSQFNPGRPLDGSLWDLLSLPSLLLPEMTAPRVLVLGVGGGAVLRQIHLLLDAPDITGIDIDAVHLQIARRWFGITPAQAALVVADAVHWVQNYRGERFDLIVDDLFADQAGEPVRASTLNADWSTALLRALNPAGVIVVNSLDCRSLRANGFMSEKAVTARYRCQHDRYHNCVGVFSTGHRSARDWRDQVLIHQGLTTKQKRTALLTRLVRLR